MSEGAAKKEEKPRKFQAIRGVRDILPPETALWTRVEQTAHEVFATFGYGEIRLPIFEESELFARSIGTDTEVIRKEMYTFEDHDFAELEKLRERIFESEFALSQASDRKIFLARLDRFVSGLQDAISKRSIPLTGENLLSLKQLVEDRSTLAQLSARNEVEWESDIDLQFIYVQNALKRVKFGDIVSLRPEATASVCRAYIEHNMQQLPQPVKLYYMGPMFRRERPQRGRYRQFYQIGAEVLETARPDAAKGSVKELAKDAAIDAEVIEMLVTFFEKCGLAGTTLYINSIGHSAPNCRRGYVEKLRAELTKIKDKLGADSQRRIDTNPLRVLDSKLESEQTYIEKLPHIADHLCDECKTHYAALKRELELRGVKYQENWRLVRGLDYYMRTTFEITAPGLGSQNAVVGGGRYDGLVELLGGPPTKGIGFAIGEDRLILSLQETGQKGVRHGGQASGESRVTGGQSGRDVYIAWMGEKAYKTAIRAAKELRDAGFSVELPPAEQKFGKALGQADKLGARYALILGDNEVASGEWTLKTLASGEQTKVAEGDLLQFLRRQEQPK